MRYPSLLLLPLLAACATPGVETSTFDVDHQLHVNVPPGANHVRIWFTMPSDDPAQEISDWRVESNVDTRIAADPATGNKFLFAEIHDPDLRRIDVQTTFAVHRKEVRSNPNPDKTRPLNPAEKIRMEPYLGANKHIVIDDEIRRLAADITGGEANPVRASRRIYDWVLDNVDYWVKHPSRLKASPVGSSEYCLDSRTGNCTDFHSLWTALARASGIPTRLKYGSFFKGPLDGEDTDQSYHCWPEFWAPDLGWIPLDVAIADLFVDDYQVDDDNRDKVRLTTADGYEGPDAAMVSYYFGNLDSRRVTWNTGRDLNLSPPQAGEPVNAVPKAYVEIDGHEHSDWTRKLTFKEKK